MRCIRTQVVTTGTGDAGLAAKRSRDRALALRNVNPADLCFRHRIFQTLQHDVARLCPLDDDAPAITGVDFTTGQVDFLNAI